MTTPDKRYEYIALTLSALVLLCLSAFALMLLFGGCAADGSIDPAGVDAVMRGVNTGYTTYDRNQHPERYPVVQPVVPVQPVYNPYYTPYR